ncbi:MAG: hypothetical protein RBR10_12795 [Bacteroidales bacterium]|jgi:hypothetical protein|nr:hypothetical protein [Bacteroidales bacterium]MDY0370710.1 hypothetical protein [Bacteroidales bacterium]
MKDEKARKLRLSGKWTYIGIGIAILLAVWIVFTWLNIAFGWFEILPF